MSFQYKPPSRLLALLRGDLVFWIAAGLIVAATLGWILVGI